MGGGGLGCGGEGAYGGGVFFEKHFGGWRGLDESWGLVAVASGGFGGGDLDCRRSAVACRNVEFKVRFAKCAPRQKHFPRPASLSSGRQMLGGLLPLSSRRALSYQCPPNCASTAQCSHPRRHRSVGEWHMLKKRPSLNHSTSSIPRPPRSDSSLNRPTLALEFDHLATI